MTTYTLAQITDAIEATLSTATGIAFSQSYSELTEDVVDFPLLQVYPEGGQQDPSGNADRSTFRAAVRQTIFTIHADLYACQRAHVGQNMATLLPLIEALTTVIEAQDTKPYFGLDGIKAFSWSWQRVILVYGSTQASYVGARFIFEIRTF
jgi:hypothetical protein